MRKDRFGDPYQIGQFAGEPGKVLTPFSRSFVFIVDFMIDVLSVFCVRFRTWLSAEGFLSMVFMELILMYVTTTIDFGKLCCVGIENQVLESCLDIFYSFIRLICRY